MDRISHYLCISLSLSIPHCLTFYWWCTKMTQTFQNRKVERNRIQRIANTFSERCKQSAMLSLFVSASRPHEFHEMCNGIRIKTQTHKKCNNITKPRNKSTLIEWKRERITEQNLASDRKRKIQDYSKMNWTCCFFSSHLLFGFLFYVYWYFFRIFVQLSFFVFCAVVLAIFLSLLVGSTLLFDLLWFSFTYCCFVHNPFTTPLVHSLILTCTQTVFSIFPVCYFWSCICTGDSYTFAATVSWWCLAFLVLYYAWLFVVFSSANSFLSKQAFENKNKDYEEEKLRKRKKTNLLKIVPVPAWKCQTNRSNTQ